MHLDETVTHDLLGLLDARIFKPPLLGEARLDGYAGALGVADVVFVGLGLDQIAAGFKQLGGLFAGGETLHAGQLGAGELVHGAVGVERVDDRQLVALADLEIDLVVGRRDLESTGGESGIDRLVGDDGDLDTLAERAPDLLADKVGVAGIVGMDCHSDVGGDGLGASGFEREVGQREDVALGVGGGGRLDQLVTEAVHEALGRLHLDLFVGERSERNRAPVDHALAAVNVAVGEKFHERGEHGLGVAGVHGEVGAVPVAGAAELAELF